ncbi:putative calcium calmodulin dependent protein kinase [Phaeomoniella chlamydospora]|uniref:Putative calcium calmodulin dependent protein kinase n=1 Tax=Phaeomoniella chlamydospora TaxID=158046 RepID=A0A0G2EJ01_PHACM|nr:putative calcium calmodulin dependent protein kinase [Phaeomoniella chlamydospora]
MAPSSLSTDATDTNVQKAHLTEIKGPSGRQYKIERVLQDKGSLLGCVFLATDGNEKFVLKEIPRNNCEFRLEIYRRLGSCPYVRGLEDTAPNESIFIFRYLKENLLGLVQKNLPISTTKRILKDALRGLAVMHDKDIVHNDIEPNNILIEAAEGPHGIVVERTQLTDLEDSAHCPPPGNLIGAQLGNWMWRSPEAHAEGPMNKPSDIFAFAIVCIYALTQRVIFGVLKEELGKDEELLSIVLERQLSYFGDLEAFNGFLQYLHYGNPENPWIEIFQVVRSSFNAEYPREPFSLWQDEIIDEDFRDLIVKMANFNPEKRITAREALEHRWFLNV